MKREYQERVEEKGLSRALHSLHGPGQEVDYVKALVEWVNSDIGNSESDGPPMMPHSQEWVLESMKSAARLAALLGRD